MIVPFALSRGAVLLVGLAAACAIGYDPPPRQPAVWRVAADPIGNLLARWDTFWYLDIATRGYHWNGHPLEQQNVVFFPLYPLLMRLSGALAGGHLLLGGLAVSLVAFLAALLYLWRLVADERGPETATTTVALLCWFPFAVYFSAVYTESVFLLIVVAAFFHARRHEFKAAALWGLLAGLVRPNGFLLAAPMAWLATVEDADDPPARWTRALAIGAPIAGVVFYSIYLRFAVGQAFAWTAGQAAWPTIAPWTTPSAAPSAGSPEPIRAVDVAIHVGNAASIGFAALGLVPLTRLLGVAYGLFVVLNIVPPIARHGLLSLGRFMAVMFPLFIWLATIVDGRRRRALIAAFAVGQAIAAMLFFTWRPLV